MRRCIDASGSGHVSQYHRRTGTIFVFGGGAEVILSECDVTKNNVISLSTIKCILEMHNKPFAKLLNSLKSSFKNV